LINRPAKRSDLQASYFQSPTDARQNPFQADDASADEHQLLGTLLHQEKAPSLTKYCRTEYPELAGVLERSQPMMCCPVNSLPFNPATFDLISTHQRFINEPRPEKVTLILNRYKTLSLFCLTTESLFGQIHFQAKSRLKVLPQFPWSYEVIPACSNAHRGLQQSLEGNAANVQVPPAGPPCAFFSTRLCRLH
jgi:hypothetical protein